jgi:HEPN domain-containing protein
MEEYVKKWLIRANNDLRVAKNELELPKEQMITEAICFHCQQAVEKFLKAFLVTNKVEFGKTHNLEYLLELCSKVDKSFQDLELGNLTFYAVEVRYPDEFYTPDIEEAKHSVKLALTIKGFVLSKLGILDQDLQMDFNI